MTGKTEAGDCTQLHSHSCSFPMKHNENLVGEWPRINPENLQKRYFESIVTLCTFHFTSDTEKGTVMQNWDENKWRSYRIERTPCNYSTET